MRKNYVWLLMEMFSLLSCLTLVTDSAIPTYYQYLFIVPLGSFLLNFILLGKWSEISKSTAMISIIGLYFIRNVITPFIMTYGKYAGDVPISSNASVIKAILLMLFDLFIVNVTIVLLINKTKTKKIKLINIKEVKILNIKKLTIFSLLILIICLFDFYAYLKFPDIKNAYTSILGNGLEGTLGKAVVENLSVGTLGRTAYTVFTFTFDILRIFVPVSIILFIRKKYGQSIIGFLVSLFFCLLQLMFITAESAYTFISIFIIATTIYKLFPKYGKVLIIICSTVGAVSIGGVLSYKILRVSNTAGVNLAEVSKIFQGYFSGICNMAGVFNITNKSKLSTFLFDIYYMIPFRNTIFGIEGITLSDLFNSYNFTQYNILPFIGQTYHYFSLLSPMITFFIVRIAFISEQNYKNENNVIKSVAYLLLTVYSVLTPIMYNVTIYGSKVIGTILFMFILSKFSTAKYS